MPTQRLGCLNVDLRQIEAELRGLPVAAYTGVYNAYSIGDWDTATLWNEPDPSADGSVREHHEEAVPTKWGNPMLHTNKLIRESFQLPALRAVRAFRARAGAIIIPHRDYLEHPTGFTRIHLPVLTASSARNSEDDSVYHMSRGEIWFLDGRVVHSGGVLGPVDRIHLVLDFDSTLEGAPSETVTAELAPLPPFSPVARQALPDDFLDGFLRTAPCLRLAMWPALVELLARVHLIYQASADALYEWLETIAAASKRAELTAEADRMRRYFLIDGPSRTPTFGRAWATATVADGI